MPATSPPETPVIFGDVLRWLGGLSASRVRLHPTPGTATVKDALRALEKKDGLCELVDAALVEKPLGFSESEIAVLIATALVNFVRPRKMGIVTGADGAFQLADGLIRIPDVAFASRNRFPGRKRPRVAIPRLAPDLAVEVLSKSNTSAEMRRKVGEYFAAGVRLVWIVDPKKRTARVDTAVDQSVLLDEHQSLDGGDVLPGFRLALKDLFDDPLA